MNHPSHESFASLAASDHHAKLERDAVRAKNTAGQLSAPDSSSLPKNFSAVVISLARRIAHYCAHIERACRLAARQGETRQACFEVSGNLARCA
jgi:hypothetical protein